jgi:hypothetical protein
MTTETEAMAKEASAVAGQSETPVAGSCLLRRVRDNRILLAVLAISVACIAHGIRVGEFNINVDETLHAMTGVFVLDFFRDLPLSHPVQYAYTYYAHYPALSGILHWPPLFYMVEGLVFALLGPSVESARITVLLFALTGIYFWFQLVKGLQDEWTAAVSSLMVALLPSMLLYEKAVMLEIPALTMAVAAIYFWVRYLREERVKHLYCFAVSVALAFLIKYTIVFLAPFCLLTALMFKKWRLVLRWHVLGALAAIIVPIAPYYYLFFKLHWSTIAKHMPVQQSGNVAALTYYGTASLALLGWPLLLLSLAGMVTARWWDKSQGTKVMLALIVCCYLTFTGWGDKEPRYVLFLVPGFAYFASGVLLAARWPRPMRILCRCAAVVVAVSCVAVGWSYQRPYVAGYAAVAQRITSLSDRGMILYDANIPGNFIFFLRAHDPNRHFVVLRKLIYVSRMKQEGGSVELVHSHEQVLDLISRYGIRYIIVSEQSELEVGVQQVLREVLKEPQFRLLGHFPIESNAAAWSDRLGLYENTDVHTPQEQMLKIPMYTVPYDIIVPVKELGAW